MGKLNFFKERCGQYKRKPFENKYPKSDSPRSCKGRKRRNRKIRVIKDKPIDAPVVDAPVEKIIGKLVLKIKNEMNQEKKKVFYLVKWLGTGINKSTWTLRRNLSNCRPKVSSYERIPLPSINLESLIKIDNMQIPFELEKITGMKEIKNYETGEEEFFFKCLWENRDEENGGTYEPLRIVKKFPCVFKDFYNRQRKIFED